MQRMRHLPVIVQFALVLWICGVAICRADCPQFEGPVANGTVVSGDITEASGMVASRKNSGVLWVHNDSGHSPQVFAVGTDGADLGTFNIVGITARDWEDIALGPGPVPGQDYLYIGDIGDNNAAYSSIIVQRVLEPNVVAGQGAVDVYGVESIELVYPGGERMDAETLLVDPINGDLYILSKHITLCRIYRAAYPQSTMTTTTLEHVGNLSFPGGYSLAVGGDITHAGDRIIIRSGVFVFGLYIQYGAAFWARPDGASIADVLTSAGCTVPLAFEPQGEAICFNRYGCGYFTVSEGSFQPVYSYRRVWPGDLNEDCRVDLPDFAVFSECWSMGSGAGDCAVADSDGDDDVDIVDLVAFSEVFTGIADP